MLFLILLFLLHYLYYILFLGFLLILLHLLLEHIRIKCAASFPSGYTLASSLLIKTPGTCKSSSFKAVLLSDIFFIGTNVSSFTYEADNCSFIKSLDTPVRFDILDIFSSLFSSPSFPWYNSY